LCSDADEKTRSRVVRIVGVMQEERCGRGERREREGKGTWWVIRCRIENIVYKGGC